MDYRILGRTGLNVSAACMGTMTFAREIGEEESARILDRFAAAGGNFIDTADNIYSNGGSEEIVGRWLRKQESRDRFVIATKTAFPTGPAQTQIGLTRKHIFEAVEASLRRLQTDYIDLYQCHWWDSKTPIEETLDALGSLVCAGKVRYLGVSNFTGWQLATALAVGGAAGARIVSYQPMYSLLVREAEWEILPVCRREGLGVIPYSPLARGWLSGKHPKPEPPAIPALSPDAALGDSDWQVWKGAYEEERKQRILATVRQIAKEHDRLPAQVALAWVAAQAGITCPILGARSVAQLEENLSFLDIRLSSEEQDRLDKVSSPGQPYPHDYLAYIANEYGR